VGRVLFAGSLLAALSGCGLSTSGPGTTGGTTSPSSGSSNATSGSTAAGAGTTGAATGLSSGAGVGSGTTSPGAGSATGAPDGGSPPQDAASASGSSIATSGGADATVPASGSGEGGAASGGSSGMALSGIQISVGGTLVPKEKVIVFLHVGHSNMAGRATSPASLQAFNYTTDPHLWAYQKGGAWKPAIEPLSPDAMTAGAAGPGMSILRTALTMAPDAYIVSIGHGESGDLGGYCTSFRKGGLFYNVVMDAAMELRGKVTFGAIWGMFGAAEFADPTHASTFGQCLQGVVTDMRTDLGLPALPALLGDWEAGATGKFTPTLPFPQMIIPQIHSAAANVPPAAVIGTVGLPIQIRAADAAEGQHHYDFAGHKGWAEHGFVLASQNGWTPWASRPVVTDQ